MNLPANQPENRFQISRGSFKGISIDRQGSTKNDKRSAEVWRANRLLNRKATDCLDRNLNGAHNFSQLIERARARMASSSKAPAFVIADVVDHKIAPEVLKALGRGHFIFSTEIVAHDFDAEVASGFDNRLDGLQDGRVPSRRRGLLRHAPSTPPQASRRPLSLSRQQ